MDTFDPRLVIPWGETYVYEFEIRNRAGTYWYHPHPHGLTGPQVYGGLAGLFLVSDDEEEDAGWKDTVLLMPGERVKFLVRFGDYSGLFLYHCHNLEHEDMGMMRNYLVEKSTSAA